MVGDDEGDGHRPQPVERRLVTEPGACHAGRGRWAEPAAEASVGGAGVADTASPVATGTGQQSIAARSTDVVVRPVELDVSGSVVVALASGSVVAVLVDVDGVASSRTPSQSMPVTSSMPRLPSTGSSRAPPSSHRATRSAAASCPGG